ncbi:MAG: AzlD domain-containing protein [Roseococcus sp.]
MSGDDLALGLLVLACAGMRGAGLLVAGRLSPDHPFVRWAASVSLATLAAFVTLAVVAPTGALALIPLSGRLLGLGAALAVLAWRGGLLAPMLAGLGGTLLGSVPA